MFKFSPFVFLFVTSMCWANSEFINKSNDNPLIQTQAVEALPNKEYNFNKALQEYSSIAKELSTKNMTYDDIKKLSKIVKCIITSMKKEYLLGRLKSESFVFQEKNGRGFPDMSMHDFNDSSTAPIIKFTIAIYGVFANLTDEFLQKIVEGSPLEFVPLLREIEVLLRFVSANPRTYGNANFTETENKKTTVMSSDETIVRVMRPLLNSALLNTSDDMSAKLSRLTTAFYNEFTGSNAEAIFKKVTEKMKRSTADDSRIQLSKPVFIALSGPIVFPKAPEFNVKLSGMQNIKEEYMKEVGIYFKPKSRKNNFDKILFLAKELLGVRENAKISIGGIVNSLRSAVRGKAEELSSKQKVDIAVARDIKNCMEIESFLFCSQKLLESFYEDNNLLVKIILKDPFSIIPLSKEIFEMLTIINMVTNKNSLDSIIQEMRAFSRSSEDGTFLLSTAMSAAMRNPSQDFKSIFSQMTSERVYLKIR